MRVSPRLRSRRSLPEICCGDHALPRSQTTRSLNRLRSASSFRHFGHPATIASRYQHGVPGISPFRRRAISRDTTNSHLPINMAPLASPQEIASLSADVSLLRRTLPPICSRVRQSVARPKITYPKIPTGCDQAVFG